MTFSVCGLSASAEDTVAPVPLDVPQVHIVTSDGNGLQLKKADGYTDAAVTVTDTDGTEISGEAQVKIRGNSTSNLNKKPYTVKFSKKLDVLGMGKAKKWALLANAFDSTQLRNFVGVGIAAELGLDYTSEQRIVEVWMDGSFRGCYHLIEPVQEGSTRVDIDIESNGGMNDFLIEREYNRVEEGATYFRTNGIRFVCNEPEEPTGEQLAYIQGTMDDIIETLKSGSREEIEQKIDVASFAKYYLLNEFIKPVDFDYSSVFFYYKGGKLYAGPAWDYDLSMGNEDAEASVNYAAAQKTDGFYCNTKHLYQWLCGYRWFFDEVRGVYLDHRDYLDSIGAQGGVIDTLYQTYRAAIDRNFTDAKWRIVYYKNFNRMPDSTYRENLDYFKSWCAGRAAWLKSTFIGDDTPCIFGDADGDGDVTVLDATVIQRVLALLPVQKYIEAVADTDGDGEVTILDATAIRLYLVNGLSDTGIGKPKP